MKPSLRKLGEFGLIEKIRHWTPSCKQAIKGIGDDTAVLPAPRGRQWCFTTDALVEGAHFLKKTAAFRVGWKAMAVSVSDMAAMGAEPHYAVVSAALASWVGLAYVRELYRGMLACARRYGVELVGGDTVSSRVLMISVAMLGSAKAGEVVYRSGARAGDLVCVTGTLGASILGKHLMFRPRLDESRFLVSRFRPHAMIDVSDGLVQDLEHILRASSVGAHIHLDQIPLSPASLKRARGNRHRTDRSVTSDRAPDRRLANRHRAIQSALGDGEDFELLFAVPPSSFERLRKAWRRKGLAKLSVIGHITNAPKKLAFFERGQEIRNFRVTKKGYRHF